MIRRIRRCWPKLFLPLTLWSGCNALLGIDAPEGPLPEHSTEDSGGSGSGGDVTDGGSHPGDGSDRPHEPMDAATDGGDTDSSAPPTVDGVLRLDTAKLWADRSFAVCWEDAGFDSEKARVRRALEEAWQAETSLTFYDWGDCGGANDARLRIRVADEWPAALGIGRDLAEQPNGITLNFTFASPPPGGEAFWSYCREHREECIVNSAVHVIGHALGLVHGDTHDELVACSSAAAEALDPMSPLLFCDPAQVSGTLLSGATLFLIQQGYGGDRPLAPVHVAGETLVLFRNSGNQMSVAFADRLDCPMVLGGPIGGDPVVVRSPIDPNKVIVLVRGTEGQLEYAEWDGSAREVVTTSVPGALRGSFNAVATETQVHVIAKLDSGELAGVSWDGSHWSAWTPLLDGALARPAAIATAEGQIVAVVRTPGGQLHILRRMGQDWTVVDTLEDLPITHSPELTLGTNGVDVHLLFRDTAGWLRHTTNPHQGSAPELVNPGIVHSPTVLAWSNNRLTACYRRNNWELGSNWWDGTWHGDRSLTAPLGGSGRLFAAPSGVVTSSNSLDIVGQGDTGSILHIRWNAGTWSTPRDIACAGNP